MLDEIGHRPPSLGGGEKAGAWFRRARKFKTPPAVSTCRVFQPLHPDP
jgi:hypothetical protein